MNDVWDRILEYAVRYPSPHNSQPIKVAVRGDRLQVFYDLKLGLPAENFGIAFGSVCAGVFLESVAIAAHALGYEVAEDLNYKGMDFASGETLHVLGTLSLKKTKGAIPDLDPELLLRRQTSRLPYASKPVPETIMAELRAEAEKFGHRLQDTAQRQKVDAIIAVNQRTLFYDLATPDVRQEIQSYLRYSETAAKRTRDGLSAKCLNLPGFLAWVVMGNYWLWKVPGIGALIKKMYLNSMRGVAHVAWMIGPFSNVQEYTRAGRVFLRVWLRLTAHDLYLHPFGSVITNPQAHAEFIKLVGADEDKNMAWMLFRLGESAKPPLAYHRTVESMRLDNA